MMDAPVRVLFPYTGDTLGGSHMSSLTLARALPRDRFEPVVALHGPGLLADYLRDHEIASRPAPAVAYPRAIPAWQQLPRIFATGRRLADWLREERIGLVHTHDRRMHLAWGLGARRVGIPHIWHQRTPKRSKRLDTDARHAGAVLAVSEFTRQTFPPATRARTTVIYNPFDPGPDRDRGVARRQLLDAMGLEAAGPILAYVANFDTRKDPMTFVRAATAIAQAHPDAAFPMFGEARAPLADTVFAAIAEAGLSDRAVHLGLRFPIEDWLAGCDILLATSREEAFGRSLVEAMIAGAVVIASDEGGNAEVVQDGETGVLVPPAAPEAFAAAAITLLADPARKADIAAAARRHVSTHLSVDAHVTQITAVYDALLSGRAP